MPTNPALSQEIRQEEIAKRAHEIYLRRGGAHGHDIDDWLQAEHELQQERQR